MPVKNRLLEGADSAEKNTRLSSYIVMGTSSLTSMIGFHVILPGDDFFHYGMTGALSFGVAAGLRSLWSNQSNVFVPLATQGLKKSALVFHIATLSGAIALSTPTTYVGLTWYDASLRDMQVALQRAEEYGDVIRQGYHGAASISNFIDSKADQMDSLATAASKGNLTKFPGEGLIWRRYLTLRDDLRTVSSLTTNSRSGFDDGEQQLSIAHRKMRMAIESETENDLAHVVTNFEEGYRQYTAAYTAMASISLGDQIQTSLDGLLESPIADKPKKAEIREALRRAERTASRTVGDISEYIQKKQVTVKALPAYRLDSPAIVSFRYIKDYWMQAVFSFALDTCLLVGVWGQILARRAARYEDDLTSYNDNEVRLIKDIADEVAELRNKP